MGNEITKQDKTNVDSLQRKFNDQTNHIIRELDNFFGPIQGFKWSESGPVIPSMDKIKITSNYTLTDDVKKQLREEREVCSNIVAVYKDTLKGLMKDVNFKNTIDKFSKGLYKDKRGNPKNVGIEKLEINIRDDKFNNAKTENICNRVIDYYFLKYRVYRLLKNLDPYEKIYNDIQNDLENMIDEKVNFTPEQFQEEMRREKKLETSRLRVMKYISESLDKLMKDNMSYDNMKALHKEIINNTNLKNYCKSIYNSYADITKFKKEDPSNFNFVDEEFGEKLCQGKTLENPEVELLAQNFTDKLPTINLKQPKSPLKKQIQQRIQKVLKRQTPAKKNSSPKPVPVDISLPSQKKKTPAAPPRKESISKKTSGVYRKLGTLGEQIIEKN